MRAKLPLEFFTENITVRTCRLRKQSPMPRPLNSYNHYASATARHHAFTLIELIVVISIIALLIGVLLPALAATHAVARASVCLSNQRQIAYASHAYATDNRKFLFPSSQMYGSDPFYVTLSDGGYLDRELIVHRCPDDMDEGDGWEEDRLGDAERTTSYAINGYFAPNHDPYGDPPAAHGGDNATSGERGIALENVKKPSQKIVVGEIAEYKDRDHFMPMYWGTAAAVHPNTVSGMFMMARMSEIDSSNGNIPRSIVRERHNEQPRFAFADGHGASHAFSETWDDTISNRADRDNNGKTDWYDPLY
jgi:prepilin-type N-terminal cleavage/methylation domain-containing protein